ncbi:MAG: hypothetical protein HY026_00465 [Deltaproteobacteria bacterium]|nr:hypothetical protein [Deltaproteobacteria bacterium]
MRNRANIFQKRLKKSCLLFLASCLFFLTAVYLVSAATVINPDVPGVTGTKHNLSMYGPGTVKSPSTTEICVFCHTPHNSNPSGALWNKADPGSTYILYGTTTMTAVSLGQPTGSSRLCLSCHDGTIAIGALLNAPGAVLASTLSMQGVDPTTGALLSTSAANLGTNLSNDHPISFAYSLSYPANNEVKDPGESSKNYPNITPAVLDKNGNVQCTSCHDPHSKTYPKFLLEALDPGTGNYGAQQCNRCHAKKYWDNTDAPVHREENTYKFTGISGTDPTPWDPYDFGLTPSPTTLSSGIDSSSAANIQVASTAGFPTAGRIRIDNELIKYTGTSGGNTFTGITRGIEGTAGAAHLSGAGVSGNDYTDDTLKMYGCLSCHRSHGGALAKHLLKGKDPSNLTTIVGGAWTCLNCHNGKMSNGSSATKDIDAVFNSTYKHDAKGGSDKHIPKRFTTGTPPVREDIFIDNNNNRHAECADCHNPHAAKQGNHVIGGRQGDISKGSYIGNNLIGTWGAQPGSLTLWSSLTPGSPNNQSNYKTVLLDTDPSNTDYLSRYEAFLCLKCHSSYAYGAINPAVPSNTYFFQSDPTADFNTGNFSYHPAFEIQGKNQPAFTANANWPANNLGLSNTFKCAVDNNCPEAGLGGGGIGHTSLITCSDCHGNSSYGSTDPKGPHGSSNKFLLRSKETVGGSPTNLCYNCHRRDVYGDEGYCPPNANYSRVSHPPDQGACSGSPTSPFYTTGASTGNNSNIFGILCLSCHGGRTATQNGLTVIDGIHGSNTGLGTNGTTQLGKRMMNGACITGYQADAINIQLWFKTAADTVCNHSYTGANPATITPNYNYLP